MNIYLPGSIFFIIYSYVGHNSLYLNKDYYNILMERRKEFVERPLKMTYRLCKWKQKYYDIENNYSRKARPCMRVDDFKELDISGGRIFGNIEDNGNLLYYTKKFEDSIIPVSECRQTAYPYPCMVVYYWTLFSLKCKNLKRYNIYKDLWVIN